MKIPAMLQYGVIALLDVANNEINAPVSSFAISERQGITSNVLEKIMRNLRISGIIEAVRGPKGGYTIARPIEEISLLDVFDAVDSKVVNKLFIEEKEESFNELNKLIVNYLATIKPLVENSRFKNKRIDISSL
jgi:Rrf2 family protein